jgi:hypothetical protein
VAWILRLVEAGAGGDDRGTDVMEIAKPDDLRDIANLGLSLAEAKQVLAAIQREVVAAQAGTMLSGGQPAAPAAALVT